VTEDQTTTDTALSARIAAAIGSGPGHGVLYRDVMRVVNEAMAARDVEPPAGDVWRIAIDVPLRAGGAVREGLFDAVCDAVSAWEPADREGWDAFVFSYSHSHSAAAEIQRLHSDVRALKENLVVERDGWKDIVDAARSERDEAHAQFAELRAKAETVDIVFTGRPGPGNECVFVEVERDGRSIRYGEWIDRPDGLAALRIPGVLAADRDAIYQDVVEKLTDEQHERLCHCDGWPAACISGSQYTRHGLEPNGTEDTINALAELGYLRARPAGESGAKPGPHVGDRVEHAGEEDLTVVEEGSNNPGEQPAISYTIQATHVEPGTPYVDEPDETVPPGWYVVGSNADEGLDLEIQVLEAMDDDGADIRQWVAERIAAALSDLPRPASSDGESTYVQYGTPWDEEMRQENRPAPSEEPGETHRG
jgi:hypothetical protein